MVSFQRKESGPVLFDRCFNFKSVFFDLRVQRGPGNAQQFGGAGTVSGGHMKRFTDKDTGEPIDAVVKQRSAGPGGQPVPDPFLQEPVPVGVVRASDGVFFADGQGYFFGAQGRSAVKNKGFVNDVGQFANITGPGVTV